MWVVNAIICFLLASITVFAYFIFKYVHKIFLYVNFIANQISAERTNVQVLGNVVPSSTFQAIWKISLIMISEKLRVGKNLF